MLKPVIVRKPQLREVTGLSVYTVSRMERAGKFPKRRQLSDGSSGWLYSELEAWAQALPRSEMGLRGERISASRKHEARETQR